MQYIYKYVFLGMRSCRVALLLRKWLIRGGCVAQLGRLHAVRGAQRHRWGLCCSIRSFERSFFYEMVAISPVRTNP